MREHTITPPAVARVLVVDDHRTFAELLAGALDRESDLASAGHAATAAEGIAMCAELRPDIVIMDVQLPDLDGFAATEQILAADPDVRVVVLTAHAAPEFVARAAAAGACGFLPKDGSLSVMLDVLRTARPGSLAIHPDLMTRLVSDPHRNGDGNDTGRQTGGDRVVPALTQRESDVLALLGQGKDVRLIARELEITPNTARGYIKSVLLKLGAHSQLEAVVLAVRHGLLRIGEA